MNKQVTLEQEIETLKNSIKRVTLFECSLQWWIEEYSEKLKYEKDKVPYEAAIKSATFFRDKFRGLIEQYSKELKAQEEEYKTIIKELKEET